MKTETGKHTPGPLTYQADGCDGHPAVMRTLEGGDSEPIAVGINGCTEADLRQMAAAPEMLEALRELLADEYLSDPVNGDRMESARAAVLKATGEAFGMPFDYPVSAPIWRDGKPVDPADVPRDVRKRIHWAARNGDAFIVHDGAEWQWD